MPRKTHCLRGHPRTPENVGASRACRTCEREQNRKRRRTPKRMATDRQRSKTPEYKEWDRQRSKTPEWKEQRRQQRLRLKLETFNHYGGPTCRRCGETGLASLQLDHVNGDGAEHRRSLSISGGRSGHIFYQALKRLGFPNDPPLQVLCRSCHRRKTAEERRPTP